jgi:hypothetical protein
MIEGAHEGTNPPRAMKRKVAASIGKLDILATSTYDRALLEGSTEADARDRGMVKAIMGARARSGQAGAHDDDQTDETAVEKKKRTMITAESFDRQVADKMGQFFQVTFLPGIRKLVEAGMSYDEVKWQVRIPATWARRTPACGSH